MSSREWREKNKEKHWMSSKAWRKAHPDRVRASNLKRYGLSLNDYDSLYLHQDGVCAICLQPETAKNQHGLFSLPVDHDHKTGKVRGLLCNRCNRVLGLIEDNPLIAEAMSHYLKKAK